MNVKEELHDLKERVTALEEAFNSGPSIMTPQDSVPLPAFSDVHRDRRLQGRIFRNSAAFNKAVSMLSEGASYVAVAEALNALPDFTTSKSSVHRFWKRLGQLQEGRRDTQRPEQ
jgi:hypothetical protein